MAPASRPLLAVTCGDPAGVGPDICLEALAQDFAADVVLIGDHATLRARASKDPGLPAYQAKARAPFSILDVPLAAAAVPCEPDEQNAAAILQTLVRASKLALAGELDAVVTAPVSKKLLSAAEPDFIGQTEYLAMNAGVDRPVMMFVSPKLKVALASTHIPLSKVEGVLTQELLLEILAVADPQVRAQLGVAAPKWKVCGLNPHAGEDGMFGDFEQITLRPFIEKANAAGLSVSGPHPADTVYLPGNVEADTCILAMFHDQALPVLKRESFASAVNVTLGLPYVRTSVDHGTAYDLAATGKADASSLCCAIELAATMVATQRASRA